MTESKPLNIRQTYLYLVSFATLVMLIIGSVQLIMGFTDLVYPDPTPKTGYIDMKFKLSELQKNTNVAPADLDKQIEENVRRQELAEKHYRVRKFINSLALVVVSLPVYLYHWRKIQRSGDNPAQ